MAETSVRAIELMDIGSFSKETIFNDSSQNLALGISGAAVIALTNVDHTLTTDNQGEAMRFVQILTGALTANVNVIVPAESRVYVADNRTTGAFTVTFKTAAGGGIAVDQGVRTLIYCDGTTVYPVASGTGGGGGSGAPTDATYLVQSPHALLTGERAVTDTPTVTWDFATPGAASAQIPDGGVTYAKVQDVTPTRLLGRYAAGSGDVQEITPGTGLTLDASGVLTATATGQPLDATLTALAGLATGADQLPYFTGTDTASQTTLTPFARTLLDDADQAAMRTTLALTPGTDVQAFDATLGALAGVTTGADMLPFFTGTDLASSTVLTAFMRSLLDDPDAATARATLGVTGGGGSSDFLGLTDTPDSYTGQGGKVVAVNPGATALEFVPLGGGGEWTRVAGAAGSTARTGLLAFWRLEEASGNRVDSVSAQALVPTGAPGSAAGKIGQAVAFDTGTGTYLAAADSATLSVGTHQDFTVAAWVYFNGTPSGSRGIVGKGNGSIAYSNTEYALLASGTQVQWYIGNGSASRNVAAAGVTLTSATWYFLVAWYDAAADIQYVQVNNGTPSQTANDLGSFDAPGPLEVGRVPQWTGSTPFDGRIDTVMFWKRVLTAGERTDLWNGGAGLDYADLFPAASYLHPTTSTDQVLAGGATPTAGEPLESTGGVKLGTSTGTVDGIVRWSGTDFEGRKGGAWVSMTSGGGSSDFLGLTDTPDAYTGQGGNLVTVNAGATGLDYTPLTAAGRALLDDADAAAQRATLGLGTMATQNASAVAITGGSASLGGHAPTGVLDVQGSIEASDLAPGRYLSARIWPVAPAGAGQVDGVRVEAPTGAGVGTTSFRGVLVNDPPVSTAAIYGIQTLVSAGTNRYNIHASGTAANYFGGTVQVAGNVGIGRAPHVNRGLDIKYDSTSGKQGLMLSPSLGGAATPIIFTRWDDGIYTGSITTTDTGTAYNTSSDARLKHAMTPLTDALTTLAALRPVRFRWNADDSSGIGFLAHELQTQIPEAVTGEPDAVHDDGSVQPQQVDHSKLVPWLTAAVQELAAQVQTLTARITTLEEALGL